MSRLVGNDHAVFVLRNEVNNPLLFAPQIIVRGFVRDYEEPARSVPLFPETLIIARVVREVILPTFKGLSPAHLNDMSLEIKAASLDNKRDKSRPRHCQSTRVLAIARDP